MNCCQPEKRSTEEHGKMLKRMLTIEECRLPPRMREDRHMKGKIEGLPERHKGG